MVVASPVSSWVLKLCEGPWQKAIYKDLHGDAVRDFGIVEEPRPGNALALSLDYGFNMRNTVSCNGR